MNKPNYNILTPFKRWTIQNFPFIEEDFDAITNYQLLCKIVDYLNKINENEKELEKVNNELIDAFNSLKDYVDNYFENLDVQEEINNKLDDMVEDGTLEEIITSYINLKSILAFNTLNDLKNATNLIDGSFAKTYGKTTYNDGYGALYKIREILNTDVVDNVHIIALTNSNTLIAELIPENGEEYIIMGDSYGAMENSWVTKLINKLDVTCYNFSLGGLGFSHISSLGYNFLQYLQYRESSITDKTKITKIIVCGGYNDYDESFSDIIDSIIEFIEYIELNYPNAKLYIGMIGFNKANTNAGGLVRDALATVVYPAYAYNYFYKKAPIYINNSELILHNSNLIGDDNVHPTESGQEVIARSIYNFLIGGECKSFVPKTSDTLITATLINDSTTNIAYTRNNNFSIIRFTEENLALSSLDNITVTCGSVNNSNGLEIGTITTPYLFPSIHKHLLIPCVLVIRSNNVSNGNLKGYILINEEKKIKLYCTERDSNGYITYSNVDYIRIDTPLELNFLTLYN